MLSAASVPDTHDYDISMTIYSDATYQVIAPNNHRVPVPEHAFIGLEMKNGAGHILQIDQCWITPTANSDNAMAYYFVEDGCPSVGVCHVKI